MPQLQTINPSSIPSQTSSTPKTRKKDFAKYAAMNITGAAIGYLIPAKADGADIVSGMNGSSKLILAKTKQINPAAKYRNALIGCLIGTILTGLYNILKNDNRTTKYRSKHT